ncbi:MAG: DNA-binding protein [Chloroflexi bacterium RBG_16_57_8]|nr:MAG: DNA-binding protein [Chloroflexi bacterium RBG_16_57_8]
MGFEKFGTVSFTAESKATPFVDYLEKGQVMATKCKKCGGVNFPPKMDCPSCLSSDVEWFEITGPATLITFAEVTYGPTGFENDTPYTLALADYGNFKVFGRMCKDIPAGDFAVGMKVKVVPVKLPGDRISYEFLKAT